jgi:hypothetical protein
LEFGRSIEEVRTYWGLELTKGLKYCDLSMRPIIEEHTEKWVLEQCDHIIKKKLSAKDSEKFIKNQVRDLQIKMLKDESMRQQAAFDIWNEMQIENATESLKHRDDILVEATSAISAMQLAKGALVARIVGNRVNHGKGERLIKTAKGRYQKAAEMLGTAAFDGYGLDYLATEEDKRLEEEAEKYQNQDSLIQ